MSNSIPNLTSSSLFSVSNKIVLVTGGSSGLGLAMATSFVENGAKVYIAARKKAALDSVAQQLNALRPGSCVAIVSDLKDKAGCDALAKEISSKESKLDVLVNNSGMAWGGPLVDFPEKDGWDRVMGTNVKSIFYVTTALLPLLTKDADAINPASVINISSIFGILTDADAGGMGKKDFGSYSYAASKAAANHISRVLAASLAGRHVNVNAIAPGIFPTNMTRHSISKKAGEPGSPVDVQPTGRLGTPEDIAGTAVFLASRAASHITGQIIALDGGYLLGVAGKETKSKL